MKTYNEMNINERINSRSAISNELGFSSRFKFVLNNSHHNSNTDNPRRNGNYGSGLSKSIMFKISF